MKTSRYPSTDDEFWRGGMSRLGYPEVNARKTQPSAWPTLRGGRCNSTSSGKRVREYAVIRNDVRRDATGTGGCVRTWPCDGGGRTGPSAGDCLWPLRCVFGLVAAAFAGDEDGHRDDDDADADAARSNHGATPKPPERPHLSHTPCDLGSCVVSSRFNPLSPPAAPPAPSFIVLPNHPAELPPTILSILRERPSGAFHLPGSSGDCKSRSRRSPGLSRKLRRVARGREKTVVGGFNSFTELVLRGARNWTVNGSASLVFIDENKLARSLCGKQIRWKWIKHQYCILDNLMEYTEDIPNLNQNNNPD